MFTLIKQSLRFGAVGVINTAIGVLAIFAVLYFFNAGPAIANGIGYAIGLSVSFVLNKKWTFEDQSSNRWALSRYLLVAATSYLCNLGIVLLGTRKFSADPYLIQLAGMATYTATMFLGCRYFAFQPSLSDRDPPIHA